MRLLILSSTERQRPDSAQLPALERYRGIYPTLLRSLQRNGRLRDFDVVFVTAMGVFKGNEGVPYRNEPMTDELASSLRGQNLRKLERIFSEKDYGEVYVNVGQKYLKSISGFENFTNAPVTYAKGVLGQKATHMKQWLQERA